MKWFLYAVSLLWIAFGAWIILYTSETRDVYRNMVNRIDRKFISILPAVVGILLLFGAFTSRNSWFIRMIGLMAIIKGVVLFSNPFNMYDKLNDWYLNSVSDQTYRLFGIIYLILGTSLISWIY